MAYYGSLLATVMARMDLQSLPQDCHKPVVHLEMSLKPSQALTLANLCDSLPLSTLRRFGAIS